jgi:2-phosphosulfolactate phosphatase
MSTPGSWRGCSRKKPVHEDREVVIDVLRATTTIIEALANGARGIYPTESTEDAVRLAASLGREDTLLCGERKRLKIEGFDLGNSPLEFSPEVVENKKLVMSTTNGTRALALAHDGESALVCAFTNISAVAEAIADSKHIVIMCAGFENHFSAEDALCAGHLIDRIIGDSEEGHELNDASMAARSLASARKPTRRFLAATAGGRSLAAIGLEDDIDACARVDQHDVVGVMKDQTITKLGS